MPPLLTQYEAEQLVDAHLGDIEYQNIYIGKTSQQRQENQAKNYCIQPALLIAQSTIKASSLLL